MHATRQTVNYMYGTTPYQPYIWSGNRSYKFVLLPLKFDPLKLTTLMLYHVPLRFWNKEQKKKMDFGTFWYCKPPYHLLFHLQENFSNKWQKSSCFFSFLFLRCFVLFRCFFFSWSLNKGAFMTNHRALTACKSTKA